MVYINRNFIFPYAILAEPENSDGKVELTITDPQTLDFQSVWG